MSTLGFPTLVLKTALRVKSLTIDSLFKEIDDWATQYQLDRALASKISVLKQRVTEETAAFEDEVTRALAEFSDATNNEVEELRAEVARLRGDLDERDGEYQVHIGKLQQQFNLVLQDVGTANDTGTGVIRPISTPVGSWRGFEGVANYVREANRAIAFINGWGNVLDALDKRGAFLRTTCLGAIAALQEMRAKKV